MKTSGAVVVITGASSGIGRATAMELASRGARVVLAARQRAALEIVAAECESTGAEALAVVADTTRQADADELARRAVAAYGRIDVWINNAGVALFAKFGDAPAEVWQRVVETNLFGYANGARAALAQFRKQHRGILINIGSGVSGAPMPFSSAYVASKYAVRGLCASLRMEMQIDGERDIHICHVMPSAIDTPLFQHAANYSGRAAKALDPVYDARTAAQVIADLVEHPRAEQTIGRAASALMAQYTATPRVYERRLARILGRNQLAREPAPPTDGNLFAPSSLHAIDGGWRERGTLTAFARRWPAAVAATSAAGLLLALAIVRRK
jgi:short-subunit dehydrogenase